MSAKTKTKLTAKDKLVATLPSLRLPNGHGVRYVPEKGSAYTVELLDEQGVVFGRICSCNGVSRSCPEGKSPSCDCTKNPPVLTCV